jgi:hypothetical protein
MAICALLGIAVMIVSLVVAPGANRSPAYVVVLTLPAIGTFCAFIALAIVGLPVRLWEEWHRIPLWARIVFFTWISLGFLLAVLGAWDQPLEQRVLFKARLPATLFIAGVVALIAAVVATVVVVLVFFWIDDDFNYMQGQLFAPEQPQIVWIMMGVGAFAGFALRCAMLIAPRTPEAHT